RRHDLRRDVLSAYGVEEDEDFVVLHSGARIKFTQWPHYTELAEEIATKLRIKVVFMADDGDLRGKLPPSMLESRQIIYIAQKMPFDHFDAFMSFCAVFVGNDS